MTEQELNDRWNALATRQMNGDVNLEEWEQLAADFESAGSYRAKVVRADIAHMRTQAATPAECETCARLNTEYEEQLWTLYNAPANMPHELVVQECEKKRTAHQHICPIWLAANTEPAR